MTLPDEKMLIAELSKVVCDLKKVKVKELKTSNAEAALESKCL